MLLYVLDYCREMSINIDKLLNLGFQSVSPLQCQYVYGGFFPKTPCAKYLYKFAYYFWNLKKCLATNSIK